MAPDTITTENDKPVDDKKKTIPELSYETKILTERIAKMEPGELITYDQFTATCGRDVRSVAASTLQSALHRALSQHDIVCECVRTVGYRRLVGNDLVKAQAAGTKRIHNEARRRVRKLKTAKYDDLDQTGKVSMNALLSAYGMISHTTKGKSISMIESKIKDATEPLPIGRTMELFQGK